MKPGYYYSHFIDGKTEAQRGPVTPSLHEQGQGCESEFKAPALNHYAIQCGSVLSDSKWNSKSERKGKLPKGETQRLWAGLYLIHVGSCRLPTTDTQKEGAQQI